MQTYDYLKSVLIPFAYSSTQYFPDIPYQGAQSRVPGTVSNKDYTVAPGGVVEALLVSPCLYTAVFENTISKLITFYSAMNPTSTGPLYNRYGISNDGLGLSTSSSAAMYLHKGGAYIQVSAPATYEACMYVKTLANNSENPDTMFALPGAQTGTLQATDKLWINALPVHFEKRAFDPASVQLYRPGVSVHYLIRIKNNSASNITVSTRSHNTYVLGEREDGIQDSATGMTARSSPLGFTHYVLEKLRNKYCIMAFNHNDAAAVEAMKAQIEKDIKIAINELAQNWYDMLKAVPGLNLNKLINFIIFYLE